MAGIYDDGATGPASESQAESAQRCTQCIIFDRECDDRAPCTACTYAGGGRSCSYNLVGFHRKACERCHTLKRKCDHKWPCSTCAQKKCEKWCFYSVPEAARGGPKAKAAAVALERALRPGLLASTYESDPGSGGSSNSTDMPSFDATPHAGISNMAILSPGADVTPEQNQAATSEARPSGSRARQWIPGQGLQREEHQAGTQPSRTRLFEQLHLVERRDQGQQQDEQQQQQRQQQKQQHRQFLDSRREALLTEQKYLLDQLKRANPGLSPNDLSDVLQRMQSQAQLALGRQQGGLQAGPAGPQRYQYGEQGGNWQHRNQGSGNEGGQRPWPPHLVANPDEKRSEQHGNSTVSGDGEDPEGSLGGPFATKKRKSDSSNEEDKLHGLVSKRTLSEARATPGSIQTRQAFEIAVANYNLMCNLYFEPSVEPTILYSMGHLWNQYATVATRGDVVVNTSTVASRAALLSSLHTLCAFIWGLATDKSDHLSRVTHLIGIALRLAVGLCRHLDDVDDQALQQLTVTMNLLVISARSRSVDIHSANEAHTCFVLLKKCIMDPNRDLPWRGGLLMMCRFGCGEIAEVAMCQVEGCRAELALCTPQSQSGRLQSCAVLMFGGNCISMMMFGYHDKNLNIPSVLTPLVPPSDQCRHYCVELTGMMATLRNYITFSTNFEGPRKGALKLRLTALLNAHLSHMYMLLGVHDEAVQCAWACVEFFLGDPISKDAGHPCATWAAGEFLYACRVLKEYEPENFLTVVNRFGFEVEHGASTLAARHKNALVHFRRLVALCCQGVPGSPTALSNPHR